MINTIINNRSKENLEISEEAIKELAKDCIERLEISGVLELEIIFVDEAEIEELNKKHRGIAKPTDVLSFPQTQFQSNEVNLFGSIVICPGIAKERRESINELVKHGILHLAGYDHEENEEEWEKTAKIIGSKL